MGSIKIKGANFMRRKLPNTHPKDIIKTQRIFPGDLVQVVSGEKDFGKQGKVLEVLKDRNLIVVQGIGMAVKHLKPNPFYPAGGKISKETPIHYSRVQLVDSTIDKPVKVELKWVQDPAKKRAVLTRFSTKTGSFIPVPEPENKFKDQEDGRLDANAEMAKKITFVPNIDESPFPASFLNELERMRRKNREGKAL